MRTIILLLLLLPSISLASNPQSLLGVWAGPATSNGQTATLGFHFSKSENGDVLLKVDLPQTNIMEAPLGKVEPDGEGFHIRKLTFHLENETTLAGDLIVPGHTITFRLTKDAAIPALSKLGPPAKIAKPVWAFKTEAPIWSSPEIDNTIVIFGSNDGNVYALQTADGKLIWKFHTAGAVFGKPTIYKDAIYVLSDDGYLYKLNRGSGKQIWKFDTGGGTIARSFPAKKESDYDYLCSSAVIENGTAFVGSANGKFFAIDENTGKEKWSFQAEKAIRSIPAAWNDIVYFASWDHFIYALDQTTGAVRWKFDTGDAVNSSPLVANNTVYIGSRVSDIFALDAATGKTKWQYFYWLSWVESSPRILDNVLYVGSSDYQLVFALNASNGSPVWSFDSDGSAWSSPAVTNSSVFIGAVGTVGYMADHHGAFFAINRKTGREQWRYPFQEIPGLFTYGVATSPAVANGLVMFGALDGTFYAFRI